MKCWVDNEICVCSSDLKKMGGSQPREVSGIGRRVGDVWATMAMRRGMTMMNKKLLAQVPRIYNSININLSPLCRLDLRTNREERKFSSSFNGLTFQFLFYALRLCFVWLLFFSPRSLGAAAVLLFFLLSVPSRTSRVVSSLISPSDLNSSAIYSDSNESDMQIFSLISPGFLTLEKALSCLLMTLGFALLFLCLSVAIKFIFSFRSFHFQIEELSNWWYTSLTCRVVVTLLNSSLFYSSVEKFQLVSCVNSILIWLDGMRDYALLVSGLRSIRCEKSCISSWAKNFYFHSWLAAPERTTDN